MVWEAFQQGEIFHDRIVAGAKPGSQVTEEPSDEIPQDSRVQVGSIADRVRPTTCYFHWRTGFGEPQLCA